jgi:DNA-binding response OmpR family regulator
MILTIPYQQDMQQFTLSDPQSGSILVTADLTSAITTFCGDYPDDPDCLARTARSPITDAGVYFILVAILTGSVIMAAFLGLSVGLRRTKSQAPEKDTILIVDDSPDIVEMIHLLLKNKGYSTLMAGGGNECLEIIRTKVPDLILLDVMMEPMDGWETLEQIKKNPETKNIPVLMITGKKLTAAEAKQYNVCIDDYIMKPFEAAELYAAVEFFLARKKKLRETLQMATRAGVPKEKVCELARLTRHISVNKKIVDILQDSHAVPQQVDLESLDKMSVVDYITHTTQDKEKRAEQLRSEINSSFRSRGLPEFTW